VRLPKSFSFAFGAKAEVISSSFTPFVFGVIK